MNRFTLTSATTVEGLFLFEYGRDKAQDELFRLQLRGIFPRLEAQAADAAVNAEHESPESHRMHDLQLHLEKRLKEIRDLAAAFDKGETEPARKQIAALRSQALPPGVL